MHSDTRMIGEHAFGNTLQHHAFYVKSVIEPDDPLKLRGECCQCFSYRINARIVLCYYCRVIAIMRRAQLFSVEAKFYILCSVNNTHTYSYILAPYYLLMNTSTSSNVITTKISSVLSNSHLAMRWA